MNQDNQSLVYYYFNANNTVNIIISNFKYVKDICQGLSSVKVDLYYIDFELY